MLQVTSLIDYQSSGNKDKPNVHEHLKKKKQGIGLKFKRKQLFLIFVCLLF